MGCETCDLSPNDCKNGGHLSNCQCVCQDGFSGALCDKPSCPASHGQTCSGHGVCRRWYPGHSHKQSVLPMAQCACSPGFSGRACERAQGIAMSPVCSTCGMK